MINNQPNIDIIEMIAKVLNTLGLDAVFAGGSCCSLYITDDGARDFRPTKDVDIVVEAHSLHDYYKVEKMLSENGFTYDMSPGAPICRKIYNGILVDVMPTAGEVLNFSNTWFREAYNHTIAITLPGGITIWYC